LAALAAAGVAGPRWVFEGFLPRSGRDRRDRLAAIAADPRGSVLFEAPGRVAATLRDLATACGADRPGAVARELTKIHEQIVRGPLGELVEAAADGRIPARGEFVIVVGMAAAAARVIDTADLASARAAVERLVAEGVARGEAARRVATETGIPRRQLYGR
jgi:16S rRNA (cytidine1402-2'-O)-methyltransferase